MYTLSSNFRVKEVTSIAVKVGVRVEFVKTDRVNYQFTFQLGGETKNVNCLGQNKALGD